MAVINHATKEAIFKVVYCGTPVGGKTTSLSYVHDRMDKGKRGELVSLSTSSDRTLYFDFLPIRSVTVNGFQTRFQLYTVPGQVQYNATRQLVLRDVDGLVFVADSQPDRMKETVDAYQTMWENIRDNGNEPERVPLVLQFNKRDLQDVVPPGYLNHLLGEAGQGHTAPSFETVATTGHNVFAALETVSQQILQRFQHATAA